MAIENLTSGAVKAAMNEAGAKSADLWMVPIDEIKVLEGFNVRTNNAEYQTHIINLGESMLANGFYRDKPLSGFVAKENGVDVIYVTDGHSRLAGAKYAIERGAEITTLPVVTKPAGTSLEDITVGLIVSNAGKPLSPIEKAAVCKRLVGYGMDEATIAKRLGFTAGYVKDLLMLIAAPKKIRAMVESGEVNASNACGAIKKHGDKAAEVLGSKLAEAKAAGKTKLTKKAIKAPKRDLVADGVQWIQENGSKATDGVLARLLAHLAGRPAEEVLERLEGVR